MKVEKVGALSFPSLEKQLSFSGLDSWTNFVQSVYDYKIHRYAVLENSNPVAAISLTEVKHPIFGHYLITAPFGSYGGFASRSRAKRAGHLSGGTISYGCRNITGLSPAFNSLSMILKTVFVNSPLIMLEP